MKAEIRVPGASCKREPPKIRFAVVPTGLQFVIGLISRLRRGYGGLKAIVPAGTEFLEAPKSECGLASFICLVAALLTGLVPTLTGCGGDAGGDWVVVYTALDQIYSEPILEGFERETGIEARAVYDTEAAKTTGLVARLLAERERPRCDVFWNNEIIQTLRLKNEGLIEPYRSPGAEAVPAGYKDPEGHWTGFAARARVLVFNTEELRRDQVPNTILDLLDPRWRGRVGMGYPLFGTTATHGAVLYAGWGEERAREFFAGLAANEVQIMEGNATVCRAVADGELPLGLTDTDDVNLQRSQGRPVDWVLLDHEGRGALLIPNTLALIKGAPNAEAGRRLIDYLLTPEVETRLAGSPSAQIPLIPADETDLPPVVADLAARRFMDPDFERAAPLLPKSADMLKSIFARP